MNLQPISSPQNPRFKLALRLRDGRGRKQQGRVIIDGWREISRATDAGLAIEEVFVREGLTGEGDGPLASLQERLARSVWLELPEVMFRTLAYGDREDGIVAVARRPGTELDRIPADGRGLILVLDSVEKPGNLGAIVRSADGAGAAGVIVADLATDPFHANSIRSSVATVFSLPLAQASGPEVIDWLRGNQFRILLADGSASRSLFDVSLGGKVAVVLGSEARGLASCWRSLADADCVGLPMHGLADSLNVSATAAVILYEAARQRRAV
jgi:RNA methyltransferase, TrmH family